MMRRKRSSRLSGCAALAASVCLCLPGVFADGGVVPQEQWAVLFPWVVQVLGVVVYFLLTHFELPIPYAATMFFLGAIMGMGAYHNAGANDHLTISIVQWSQIDSSVLLLVFLPGLIFRDAIEINFHYFSAAISQILLLAFPVVLFGAALTACFTVYVLPYGWSWSIGMTLGAILGSTDPVAVSTALRRAGAPPRLSMHLGGESMLNDGSAVVIYSLFAQKFFASLGVEDFGRDIGLGEGVAIFFKMSVGGFFIGVAFAGGLLVMLTELDRRLEKENNVLQVAAAVSMAFLSYFVSEQVCGMSGVLACVVTGITSSAFGKGLISDPDLMDSYLKLVEHLLNTLLFTLGGAVWGRIVANQDRFALADWGYLLLLYVAVMVIRMIQIGLVYPIMKRIGIQTNWQESIFLVFGGLRGSVGIALALALNRSVHEATDNVEHRLWTNKLVGLSGGVTALTLLVNGSLAGPMLRKLGLSKEVGSRKAALKVFEQSAKNLLVAAYKSKVQEPRFSDAQLSFVKSQVLFMKDVCPSDVERAQLPDTPATTPNIPLAFHPPRGLSRKNSVFEDMLNEEKENQHLQILLRSRNHSCLEDAVADVRLVFLELLDAAYTELLHRGELDVREDNGYNLDVLKQSVALAIQSIDHQEATTVDDFQYTQQFAEPVTRTKWFVARWIGADLMSRFRGAPKNPCSSQSFQQLRIQVLLALEFIEAHNLAEDQTSLYLNTDQYLSSHPSTNLDDCNRVDAALEQVLQESTDQVCLAKTFLSQIPRRDMEDIHSRYLSSILLHRLGRFVEQNYEAGIIHEKEATMYLRKIDQRVSRVHYCPNPLDRRLAIPPELPSREAASQKTSEVPQGAT